MLTKRFSQVLASAALTAICMPLVPAVGACHGLTPFGEATRSHLDAGLKRNYQGHLIAVGGDSISFLGQDGATHGFTVAVYAMITRDGTNARLRDLQQGDWVQVTTESQLQFKEVATIIEASSRSQSSVEASDRTHDLD